MVLSGGQRHVAQGDRQRCLDVRQRRRDAPGRREHALGHAAPHGLEVVASAGEHRQRSGRDALGGVGVEGVRPVVELTATRQRCVGAQRPLHGVPEVADRVLRGRAGHRRRRRRGRDLHGELGLGDEVHELDAAPRVLAVALDPAGDRGPGVLAEVRFVEDEAVVGPGGLVEEVLLVLAGELLVRLNAERDDVPVLSEYANVVDGLLPPAPGDHEQRA